MSRSRLCCLLAALLVAVGCGAVDGHEDPTSADESPIAGGSETTGYESVGVIGCKNEPWCTGTLIGPRTVLTAAHCIDDPCRVSGLWFKLGGTKYASSQAIRHPNYDDTENYDLWVVQLTQAVPSVTPSPLNTTPVKVGQRGTLVGYGSTNDNGGNDPMERAFAGEIDITRVTEGFIEYTGTRNCGGDLGGPAFIDAKLAGVTSWGDGDNCSASTGRNARVDTRLSWIRSVQGDGGLVQIVGARPMQEFPCRIPPRTWGSLRPIMPFSYPVRLPSRLAAQRSSP